MALAGIPIATKNQKKVAVTRGAEKMMAIYCDRGGRVVQIQVVIVMTLPEILAIL